MLKTAEDILFLSAFLSLHLSRRDTRAFLQERQMYEAPLGAKG